MTPDPGAGTVIRSTPTIARVAALGALGIVVLAIAYMLLFSGGDGTKYRLLFQNGGQLVEDNQVLIGGVPQGTVDSIELTGDGQAEVGITVNEPLHEGSEAVIRSTSLSGIANRYVSISPGPDSEPELPDDQLITQTDTTTPVDLDQLFNTFDARTRKALRDFIQGQATVYAGRGEEANETYKYLNPGLTTARKVLQELTRDQQVLEDFLVDGSRVVTGVAERRDDLSALTANANQALGAIASRNSELDRALVALPPALRQANTTFVNLRATFDDLDPFVATAKRTTTRLAPFLRRLRPVIKRSTPVFANLRQAVRKPGPANDLADATGDLVPIQSRASTAFPAAIRGMDCGATDVTVCDPAAADPNDAPLKLLRPYTPDFLGALTKIGQITSNYDRLGHYARVGPVLPIFDYQGGNYVPYTDGGGNAPFQDYAGIEFGIFRRCPGASTQARPDGSNPFLDGGLLTTPAPPGDCTVTDIPPGP